MPCIITALLAACGGGGGGGGAAAPQPTPTPTVSLSSDKTTIDSGGSITLTWSSTNATGCTGSGGWSGTKSSSGTQTINGLTQSATYALACSGAGGSGSGSVKVTVTPPPALPTVTLIAASSSVALAAADTLTWSSTDATACTASGSWSGNQPTSGSVTVGPITLASNYKLTCTGAGGSTSKTVDVGVASQLPPATPIGVVASGVVVLDADSVSKLTGSTDTTLTFTGTISITANEIFILSGSAYRATSVKAANGQTVVAVTAPTLGEVFNKIDLGGNYTLEASQVVSQSAEMQVRIKEFSGHVAKSHNDGTLGAGLTFPWDYSQGPLKISGSGSLQLQAQPNIHYTSSNGFANSSIEFDALATAQAALNLDDSTELPWTTFFKVGTYRIPIPLTVVDGLFNLLGVSTAAIYVPVNVGGSLSASLGMDYSASAQTSGGILLAIAADGTVSAASTPGLGSNTLSFSTPQPSQSSNTPVLETLNFGAFTGVELKPALVVLNTIAAFGIDMKVGPELSATVEVLLPGSSPGFCGMYSGQISLQANAFYLGLKGTSTTDSASFDLYDVGATPLIASCNPQPSVTATPQGDAVVFSPLTVTVAVAPPSTGVASGAAAPTGAVSINLDDQSCQAPISAAGNGSCQITPSTSGSRTLKFQYLGDPNYQASVLGTEQIDVAQAQNLVTLTPTPNTVTVGSLVTFKFGVTPLPANSTAPLPTGNIDVRDETGTTVCSADIGATATGSCTYAYSSEGTHSMTAVYEGDVNYVPGQSAAASLTVDSVVLSVSPMAPSVIAGKTVTLDVIASDANGPIDTPPNLTWTTNNPSAATVIAGVVTGVAPGTALITVTDPVSSASAPVTVTVTPAIVLMISPRSLAVALNATTSPSVSATDASSGNAIATPPNLQWASLDEAIAQVSSAGEITGVGLGSAAITVTDPASLATASAVVTVGMVTPGTYQASFVVDVTIGGPDIGCTWYRVDSLNLTISITVPGVTTGTITDSGPEIDSGCFGLGAFYSSGSSTLTLSGNSISGFVTVWTPSNGGYYGYQIAATASGTQITGTATLEATVEYSGVGSFTAVKQ